MKTKISFCTFTVLILAVSCFALFAINHSTFHSEIKSSVFQKKHSPERAEIQKNSLLKRACTVTLTGNSCVGSELSVVSSNPVASISWLLDGVSVFDQSNARQNNGQVVAGGNGTGSAANQLYNPNRLFVDRQGNMYIPDMANNRIQKWAAGATSGTTIAGGNGSGSNANQFNRPTAVTIDAAGNLYVVDQNNSRVQKWVPGATSGTTVASALSLPTGIFLDAQGNLYVSEQNAQVVKKYTNATGPGVIIAGGNGYGSGLNQLAAPTGLFVDSNNNIYICDTDNYRVQKWVIGASSGITVARTTGNPLGVFVDGSNNIYVSDYTGYAVQKWAPGASSGTIIAGGNGSGSNPNQIAPAGVWMDAYNNLYVSDFLNGRVIKFSNIYTGTYTTLRAGTYTAKITTTDGCIVTSNAIEVKENLIPKISITSSSNVVCSNFQPTFTASIENEGSSPVIQWKINGTPVSGENGLTFTANTLTASDIVSCDLTNQEICVSPALVHSNNIILNGALTETPNVEITSSAASACEGTKIIFKAITANAGNNPTYQWKVNHVDVSEMSDTFESESLNNGDLVSCSIVSNAQNCQITSIANSNEIKIQINPILTPSIFITSNLTKIYNTSTVTFTATTTNEGLTPNYQWHNNGMPLGSNSNVFTIADLKQSDQISCTLTVQTPCASINTILSNVIDIDVIVVVKVIPPNAFTPNGDGINDVWQIDDLKSFPKCKVSVFNRNGSIMFYSIGYNKPWSGDRNNVPCPPGIYYYTINLDEKQVISGSISLMK